MRKILWMVFLFGAYMWVMSSGNDRLVLEQGKKFYSAILAWLDDADIDFQTPNQKSKKSKKRGRRWD